MRPFIIILAFTLLPVPAPGGIAQDGPPFPAEQVQPGGDHPLGAWDGIPPRAEAAATDDLWSLRTGFRKGVTDLSLPEERTAAPDVAVLKSGFFRPWAGILAQIREPVVLAEPDALAGLRSTKPVLIIPSGGLSGLAASELFRAGLAEYAASGGVVLCFSQQKGSDLSALPVPAGAPHAVNGAGWAEDSGPLFRMSAISTRHPLLSGLESAAPAIETDGFLGPVPAGGTVLLARPDGRATLVAYPVGMGWVVVTTMATDYSFGQGAREPEELALVRALVLWAKAGGRPVEAAPGTTLERRLALPGPALGASASIVVRVLGEHDEKPLEERSYPLALAAAKQGTLDFSYSVPRDAAPGIYHVEYRLLDGLKQPLSPFVEVTDGWFVVPARTPAPAPRSSSLSLSAPSPLRVEALPTIAYTGDRATMTISISRTQGNAPAGGIIVRAGGQERKTSLSGQRTEVSLDLGSLRPDQAVSYALREPGGRTIARGTVLAPSALGPRMTLDRPFQAAGGKVRITATGMGAGELSITSPGSVLRELISADSVFELPLPTSLPTGVYPVVWEFDTAAGQHREGVVPVAVRGTEVRCTNAAYLPGKTDAGTVQLALTSSDAVSASVKLRLVGPDGRQGKPGTTTVALVKGDQTVKLPFSFRPDRAGMWQLLYEITTRLPEGPGLDEQAHTFAAGRMALDAGPAAIIGLTLARPMYYGIEDAAEATVYIHGTGPARLDLLVDGKRVARKRTEGPGTSALTVPLGDLARGRHTLAASLSGTDLKDQRSLSFLFGALLPDLTVSLKTSDFAGPLMEIGIGIKNDGRTASGHSTVTLYESDPDAGGKPIGSSPVPPLEPGRQFVVVLPWQLAGKAGVHQLTAVVDREGTVTETDETNNRAGTSLNIPTVLLALMSQKAAYASDDDIRYRVRIVNYSAGSLQPLTLTTQVTDPAGGMVSSSTVTLPPLPAGEEQTIERPLGVTSPQEGTYVVSTEVRSSKPLASDSLGIAIQPTMLLTGTLEGTPGLAVPCSPFEIRYAARDAGNVRAVNGTLRIEIRPETGEQPVFTKQLPFRLTEGSFRMESVDLPRGTYSLVLLGSAVNSQWNMSREFLLARRNLAVDGPVAVTRSRAAIPRILVWTGGATSIPIEQALAGKMVREAFDGQTIYYESVTSAGEFRTKALSGVFNILLLLEVREIGGAVEALQHARGLGAGIIVVGPNEHTRSIAESLGFRFVPVKRTVPHVSFPGGSQLGLTGSLPVSGQVLAVSKDGAAAVAVLPDGRAAAVLDAGSGGKVIVAPFSPVRSAIDTGSSVPYGLLLRSAALAVMPEQERPEVSSVRLEVSSLSAPVRARIIETLPPDAEVLWMNTEGKKERGTLTFELTAGQEPRSIIYLFRAAGAGGGTTTEVFSECRGTFRSQGKGK